MWLEMETGGVGRREREEGTLATGLSRMLMAQQVSGAVQVVLSQEGPLWPSGQGEELLWILSWAIQARQRVSRQIQDM